MALDPTTLLASLAAIIGLGYLGSYLFDRTRVPDILLLMGLGAALGPLTGILDGEAFAAIAPALGMFTLLVILFDGGLSLKLRELRQGSARALLLAVVGWTLTVLAVAGVTTYALGWDPMVGLLLGAILGGTSSIAVIPVVNRMKVGDGTRVALSLESALTDVFCVVGTLTLVGVLAGTSQLDAQSLGRSLASTFSVALLAGVGAGAAWAVLWKLLERGPYAYMITLAAVLLLHVGVEGLGGSGPVAVLAFGVMLGNLRSLFRGRRSAAWELGGEMRRFQSEITFFVRAFFFVSLGVLLDPAAVTDPRFLGVAGLLIVALVAGRVTAVLAATAGSRKLAPDRRLMTFMLPRGLAAAVLAALPAQQGIAGTEAFVGYAFAVIVLTNLIVTAGSLLTKPETPDTDDPLVAAKEPARGAKGRRARKAG